MSGFVCSVCGKPPAPARTPGSWLCACAYSTSGWVNWRDAILVPDKATAAVMSPVTVNPDEDAFYERAEADVKAREGAK